MISPDRQPEAFKHVLGEKINVFSTVCIKVKRQTVSLHRSSINWSDFHTLCPLGDRAHGSGAWLGGACSSWASGCWPGSSTAVAPKNQLMQFLQLWRERGNSAGDVERCSTRYCGPARAWAGQNQEQRPDEDGPGISSHNICGRQKRQKKYYIANLTS